jgi:hypothetical protein
MEDMLIQAGIKNLKEFGYPDVTKDNILTDLVYSRFFKRILEETKAEANPCFAQGASVIAACEKVLNKLTKLS